MTPDSARALLRTAWPMLLGHLVAWLVAVLQPQGVTVDVAVVTMILSWALGTAVYLAGRWLETRTGTSPLAVAARHAGRFVLSVGITTGTPSYASGDRPAA